MSKNQDGHSVFLSSSEEQGRLFITLIPDNKGTLATKKTKNEKMN